MDDRVFVIIGASLAGAKAAETLRAEGFEGRIVLVGAEDQLPYERPPLSKGYLLGKQERVKAFVHPAGFYEEKRIELRLARRAIAIDANGHAVSLDDGEDLTYDKLLLATGSRVRPLDVAGIERPQIHYLRTIGEADALQALLRTGDPVVIVGGGWIGLETAAAAREYGCDVTLVEPQPMPLHAALGDEVASVFRDLHLAHGVDLRLGAGVREFGGIDDRMTHAVLDDNTEIPANAAIVAVGVQPNVELARGAGLTVDDGVVTDPALRTSDPDIYACGDVAATMHPLYRQHLRVDHWANALNGGPAAARSMLGQEVVYDRLPYFFTDQYDLGMEISGWFPAHRFERVVFRGDPAIVDGRAPGFLAFWVRDGRPVAGMNVNVWDVQGDIQNLIRAGFAGADIDLDRLADPSVPLASLV